MEERRKTMRRQADQDLLKFVEEHQSGPSADKVQRRKKRHAIRHACKAVLEIEIAFKSENENEWTSAKKKVKARVLDLSDDGASFFIKYPAATDQIMYLAIQLFDGKMIEAQGEVRWVRQKDSHHGYTLGVKFTHIDPANKEHVANFIEQLEATLGTSPDLGDLDD
jgi:c-di-GMP-binding flagellar brake protein YcgR